MYQDHNDEYLSHFGIKGQKWGVRRYQNADGTYTAAGKKRLQKQIAKGNVTDAPYKVNTHKDVNRYYKSESRRINQAERSGQASAKLAEHRRKALDNNVKNMHDAIDKRKADYKRDTQIRENLVDRATITSDKLRAARRTIDRDSKELNKRIEKELKKYGDTTDKTKKDINAMTTLRNAEKIYDESNKRNVQQLENHVNNMIAKYGDKKVKDISNNINVQNGEKYVHLGSKIFQQNYRYSVQKRDAVNSKGERIPQYQMVRYV